MNEKKKMFFVVSAGVVPSVTFVTCYEADDVGDRADATADAQTESKPSNWIRTFTSLPRAVNRLVRQPLKRTARKLGATA